MINYIIVLYCTDQLGMADSESAMVPALMGVFTLVYGFVFTGFLIDTIGVRYSFIIGFILLISSRVLIAFITNKTVVVAILMTSMPIGLSLGIPVM